MTLETYTAFSWAAALAVSLAGGIAAASDDAADDKVGAFFTGSVLGLAAAVILAVGMAATYYAGGIILRYLGLLA